MVLKLLITTILFFSSLASAQNLDWLKPYLKTKSIACTFSEEQLKEQVTIQLDKVIQELSKNLRAKGSEYESILQDRNHVTVGPFPDQAIFDFYVLESVSVVIKSYQFQVQTTYVTADATTVEKGLWLPLTIQDTGAGKKCSLERISLREEQRKFLPSVDLVIGEPPRIVARDLAQIMDISNTPTMGHALKKSDDSRAEEPRRESRESRRESGESRRERRRERQVRDREEREERRERRSKRYQHRRRRRPEKIENESSSPTVKASPEKSSGCSGDISPWKAIGCAVSGNK